MMLPYLQNLQQPVLLNSSNPSSEPGTLTTMMCIMGSPNTLPDVRPTRQRLLESVRRIYIATFVYGGAIYKFLKHEAGRESFTSILELIL